MNSLLSKIRFASVALLGCSLLLACGDSESSTNAHSIKNKTISGISQKGPFIAGSSVTVQELDGESLLQTGRSFRGSTRNDKGEFSIASVELASQYALVEVNGYFRNEITGNNSRSPIVMTALVDLLDRDNVNINIFTHLETARATKLALEAIAKDKSVKESTLALFDSTAKADSAEVVYDKYSENPYFIAAKQQAHRELLQSFGFIGKIEDSEDLELFGNGDGAAALLALSVLVLGDLDESRYTERMARLSKDLEIGVFKDLGPFGEMADWAIKADLDSIRKNMEAWGEKVPNFERFVRMFVSQVYNCSKDGELSGEMVCDDGGLRLASDFERVIMKKGCTSYNRGDSALIDSSLSWAVCSESGWVVDVEKNTGTLKDSRDKNEYKTIAIGNQVWMKENLRFDVDGKRLCYGGDKDCKKYGSVYDWKTAQKVCPEGWHLPSMEEWDSLAMFVVQHDPSGLVDSIGKVGGMDGSQMAVALLRSRTGWNKKEGEPENSFDTYGFGAIPTPADSIDGGSNEILMDGGLTVFWSTRWGMDFDGEEMSGSGWDAFLEACREPSGILTVDYSESGLKSECGWVENDDYEWSEGLETKSVRATMGAVQMSGGNWQMGAAEGPGVHHSVRCVKD